MDDLTGPKYVESRTRKEMYPDPIADYILGMYKAFKLEQFEVLRYIIMVAPVGVIVLFYLFVSQSTSSLICFTAFTFSIVFMWISVIILCEILNKDLGPRAMQDIAEVIKEGSEGFFVTQYGTIFRYAFMTSAGLFFMYALREIPAQSKLNEYFSPISMAFITSVSFLMGSICSAISGYAGIWVSVRANLRVAAAAKKCYNDAI